jgi:hypothetical protein
MGWKSEKYLYTPFYDFFEDVSNEFFVLLNNRAGDASVTLFDSTNLVVSNGATITTYWYQFDIVSNYGFCGFGLSIEVNGAGQGLINGNMITAQGVADEVTSLGFGTMYQYSDGVYQYFYIQSNSDVFGIFYLGSDGFFSPQADEPETFQAFPGTAVEITTNFTYNALLNSLNGYPIWIIAFDIESTNTAQINQISTITRQAPFEGTQSIDYILPKLDPRQNVDVITGITTERPFVLDGFTTQQLTVLEGQQTRFKYRFVGLDAYDLFNKNIDVQERAAIKDQENENFSRSPVLDKDQIRYFDGSALNDI